MSSLSFDGLVQQYDETRHFDPDCFDSALEYISNRFPPENFRQLFEPGIGTGRVAIPLARRGYEVTGVDISEEMLAHLRRRLLQWTPSLHVNHQKADVTELPFPDAAFDIAIAVHLFYFIGDWQRAAGEILRVLKGKGPLILMHTGMGAEIPFVNSSYGALCADQGYISPNTGATSTREVVDYFQSLGCKAEWIRERWRWLSKLRLDRALDYLGSRAYAFTSSVPEEIHTKAMEQLRSQLLTEYGDLSAEIKVPNEIYLAIVERA